jgi:hypothetical protein
MGQPIKTNQIELELDGFLIKCDTIGDFGSTTPTGDSGIDPNTGQVIKSAGFVENQSVTLSFLYMPKKHKTFVDSIVNGDVQWKSGTKKGTLIFPDEDGTGTVSYLLTGVTASAFKLPGKQGTSTNFARFEFTINWHGIRSIN